MHSPKISGGTARRLVASDSPGWVRRPLRLFAMICIFGLTAAGAERLVTGWRSQLAEPGRSASWIWAEGDYGGGEPIAFYAARDVEIDTVGLTRIAIAADETYLLYVNGQRIGCGAYRPRAPVDEYEVSKFLHSGLNRFVVELRSSRGAGGLLAEIDCGAHTGAGSSQTIVTDETWRIFRHFDPGLFGGWSSLSSGEAASLWRLPPTGRWRLGVQRRRLPGPSLSYLAPVRRRPVRLKAQHTGPWLDLAPKRRRLPRIGPKQLYDWGEEVEGFLSFDLITSGSEPGLLFLGSEPPNPEVSTPDQVILPVPGRRFWTAAFPNRFRYALLIGAEPYRRIEVEELNPDLMGLLPRRAPPVGVFGLQPPRAYSKVEEDVWGRLAGEPGKRGI